MAQFAQAAAEVVEAAVAGATPIAGDGLLTFTNNFIGATVNSLIMILVTELGDKTFFIAAILAMRHVRIVVYAGAMGALALMHVLSALMGYALPNLIPKAYTHFASAILFAYFGLRLLRDAAEMDGEGPSDELQEVEEELVKKKGESNEADDDEEDVEHAKLSNTGSNNRVARKAATKAGLCTLGAANIKVFTQAFTLTFLAEWGDRSQIATIAMAASQNPYGVIIGGLIGHAFCTGLAVIGGRMLAAKISEKAVAIIGGVLFLFFAVTSFLFGPEA